MRKHVNRFTLARPRLQARGSEIVAADARLGDARVGQRHGARGLLSRFLRAKPRLDLGEARHLAVGLFGHGANLVGGHVAGHHQDRVVGCIEAAIELERAFAVELFDFVPPADHGPAVGMVQVERCVHLFAEPRRGIVGDPHVLLFQHDVELGTHHVVGKLEAGHPVGLELHHGLELVARHPLEVAGVVG